RRCSNRRVGRCRHCDWCLRTPAKLRHGNEKDALDAIALCTRLSCLRCCSYRSILRTRKNGKAVSLCPPRLGHRCTVAIYTTRRNKGTDEPDSSAMFRHALKRNALPIATRLFASPGLRRLPPLLEMAGAALQSKRGGGYAATWQEVEGALNFIGTHSPVIFDVGANIGNWTCALLSALPETRRVVMFEPQPSCWATLEKIQSERVELEKKAASD